MSPVEIIMREERMSTKEAMDYLGVSKPTIDRYKSIGYRGVKLEFAKIGKKPVTSKEAIGRFLAAINNPTDAPGPVLQIKTRADRQAEIDAAMAEVFSSN